jgi:hypothetical protein
MSMTTGITNPDSFDAVTATDLTFTRRAWINAGPGDLYDLISDVSRIGDWSPNADAVHYDQDAGPWVGAWFSGRNRKGGKEWTTRSQIVAAEPGRRFAFTVGGAQDGIIQWEWLFTAQGTGTTVQQSWRVLRYDPVLGDTRSDVEALRDFMADSAESTLINLAARIGERFRPSAP